MEELTGVEHVHHLLPHDELEGPREVCEVARTIHRLKRRERLAVDDPEGGKETFARLYNPGAPVRPLHHATHFLNFLNSLVN